MAYKIFIHRFIFIILSIISLFIYILHPNKYVYSYNLLCLVFYLGSVVLFLLFKNKKNYFDFDILFLTTSFFAFFAYPALIYPINPSYFFVFDIVFDHNVISQATALALLGLILYMTGSLFYSAPKKHHATIGFYPLKRFTLIVGILFTLFLLLGGYSYYIDLYSGNNPTGGGIYAYINVLLITFMLVSIDIQYCNLIYKDSSNLNIKFTYKPLIFLLLAYVIIILSTGSRTVPLQIVLAVLGLYTIYYKNLSFKKSFIVIGIGIFTLASISYTRSGGGKIENIYDAFIDIIIVNRNSFAAIEYVDSHGYTYGSSMLSYILQPIPFGQSIIFDIFGLDPRYTSSARLFTTEAFGPVRSMGLGTNIIADIYLSFGVIGVMSFMLFAGWFVAKSKYLATYRMNYMIIYTVLMANSVFLVRAEFFYCLQEIIWALILFYFTKPLFLKKIRRL